MDELRGRVTAADVAVGRMVAAILELEAMRHQDLADRIGMNPQTLSGKINGRSPWQVDELVRIAESLAVPIGCLYRDPMDAVRSMCA